MRAIVLTDSDFKSLLQLKHKEYKQAYRKFTRKKKTHLKDLKLKEFFKLCTDDFNPMLYTIPMKCYFSFYLYLYLKKNSECFEFDQMRYQFLFSRPMEINLSEIARVANVTLNTVKAAFKELVKLEFLLFTDLLTEKTNQPKTAALANDHFIIGYDNLNRKVCFYNKRTKYATQDFTEE